MEFWSSRQDVWFRDDLIIGFIFHHPEEIDESGREKGKVTIEMENGEEIEAKYEFIPTQP